MTGPLCGVVETHKYEQAHSSVQARPWGFNLHPAHPHHIASSSLANKSERRRRRGTQAAQGELRCVRAHVFVCVCVVEGIDSLIPVPLPVSAECQDLPPGKTNHKAEVMDVAL